MSYIQLETDTYPAMISIDDKNYILHLGEDKLKIHGSGLKGKHMPIVCDDFRDVLCRAVFNKVDPLDVFAEFQTLSHYKLRDFQIRIYPTKINYTKNTLYFKLMKQIAASGIRIVAGASLEYVKAVDGYRPVVLFSEQDRVDFAYYKRRLAEIASRILDKPAKKLLPRLLTGQNSLEKWS